MGNIPSQYSVIQKAIAADSAKLRWACLGAELNEGTNSGVPGVRGAEVGADVHAKLEARYTAAGRLNC
jgi:hypothetical protein